MGTKSNSRSRFPNAVIASLLILGLGLIGTATGATLGPISINNGGAMTTSPDHALGFSVGQPFIGFKTSADHQLGVGFWYLVDPSGGGVSDAPPPVVHTDLFQNAPNPFNPSTTIRFSVGKAGPGLLRLYDLKGRLVATLVDEDLQIGVHELVFRPSGLASGVYLYQLKTADRTLTRRLMLVK